MREKYESLSLATLKELAKARGLKGVSALRKPELVQRMLEEDEKESSLQNENTPKGREEVKLFGESIEVKAHIEKIEGISGHADQTGLLEWVGSFMERPKHVFVVHGDDEVCDTFAATVKEKFGMEADAPFSGTSYDLKEGCFITVTEGIPIKREAEPAKKAAGVFGRLVAAGERLRRVILNNEGGANKDLARFADQINSLCDKWDR